jgi:hypothetical protein
VQLLQFEVQVQKVAQKSIVGLKSGQKSAGG